MKGNSLLLWIAQGFGSGRSPIAPGTMGSVVGIAWFYALLWPRNAWLFVLGALGGIFISVWICGVAARQLGRADPPSVVLDEIIAVPLCYMGWIGWMWARDGSLPDPLKLCESPVCFLAVFLFILFRIFDITKPWPVYQSQSLPGGWGITMDDVVAAVYVNLCWGVWLGACRLLHLSVPN